MQKKAKNLRIPTSPKLGITFWSLKKPDVVTGENISSTWRLLAAVLTIDL